MLAPGQEMPQQVGNRMCFACARRPLYHYSRRRFYLTGNGQLFGISLLGQQNIRGLAPDIRQVKRKGFCLFRRCRGVHNSGQSLRHVTVFVDVIQQLGYAPFHAGTAAPQKQHLPGIGQVPVCGQDIEPVFRITAVRCQHTGRLRQESLHLLRPGMNVPFFHQRRKFTQPFRLNPRHILKHIHINFCRIAGLHDLHFTLSVIMQLHPFQQQRMIYRRIKAAEKHGIADNQFQPLRVLTAPVVDFIQFHKQLLRAAFYHFPGTPQRALAFPFF